MHSSTLFQVKVDELIKNWSWSLSIEDENLWGSFRQDIERNLETLQLYLEKHSLSSSIGNSRHYYLLITIITSLSKEGIIKSDNPINEILKKHLKEHLLSDKPEYASMIIDTLFQRIWREDKEYFISLYKSIISAWKLFPDINSKFLEIFINFWNDQEFKACFLQAILNNNDDFHSSDIDNGFTYLCSQTPAKFTSNFTALLKAFEQPDIKKQLIYYYDYTSLIKDREYNERIIDLLTEKLASVKMYEACFAFLCTDISFALENHSKDLKSIPFIQVLSEYLFGKEKKFLIELLKTINIETCYIYWIESYVVRYTYPDQVDELISILQWSEKNKSVVYFIYDIISHSTRDDRLELMNGFEANTQIWKSIKDRNKLFRKNQEKARKSEIERKKNEKNEMLSMLSPGRRKYYRKILHDYVEYIDRKNIDTIFTKTEVLQIEESLKKQIFVPLRPMSFEKYTDEIKLRIRYQSTWGGSSTVSGEIITLNWIVKIARYLNIDLSKYKKIFVLYYPLFFWGPKIEYVLDFIKNPDEDDIDYFLLVYSEDLHAQASWLRYHNPEHVYPFYLRFKSLFNKKQKQKIVDICIDIIDNQELYRAYYIDNYLDIIGDIMGKTFIKSLWKEKYIPFNYYIDLLKNEEGSTKNEINIFKILMSINSYLIGKHKDKESILWRIEQVKNGVVECTDSLKIEYPHSSSWMRGISSLESELSWTWWRDRGHFSSIFLQIWDMNIFNQMLDLLKLSLELQVKILSKEVSPDLQLYSQYIKSLFFIYIWGLGEKFRKKETYFKIVDTVMKYDPQVTFSFNFEKLRESFWVDQVEDESRRIHKQWPGAIAKLLKEKQILLDNPIEKIIEKSVRWEKECILFLEWETDLIILENAWKKLHPNRDLPFQMENWFDYHHICRWFWEVDYGFLSSIQNKTLIWMLDFDSAYNWFARSLTIEEKWLLLQDSDPLGRMVKHGNKNGYVFLLPVPNYRKEYASSEFWDKSMLSIELLFQDQYLEWYVDTIKLPWWTTLLKMKKESGQKRKFAESTSNFKEEAFIGFIAVFELLEKIINGDFIVD